MQIQLTYQINLFKTFYWLRVELLNLELSFVHTLFFIFYTEGPDLTSNLKLNFCDL